MCRSFVTIHNKFNEFSTESVFKNYAGDNAELQRTQDFLENVFQSGAATCLICIATVKRTEAVSFCPFVVTKFLFDTMCECIVDMVMRALLLLLSLGVYSTMGERFDIAEETSV